jgi:hypothetical protein
MTATSKTTSKNERDTKTDRAKDQKSVATLVDAFLDDPPLLDNEDDDLFRQIYDAVVAETGAKSFLELIAARDITEKLFEEQRYKAISVEVIKGARQRAFVFANEGEQELEAVREYLPKISTLDRMIGNSQTRRRMLSKELRQATSDDTPPLAPKL